MSTVYSINKGVNKPVFFKGLQAQYIWWLGGGLVVLLIVFAALYISGLPSLFCVFIALLLGTGLFISVSRMSRKYGEHGLMKHFAAKSLPKQIKGCTIE